MGIFKGYAVAGCAPDEMGVGPVHAVPKLLSKAGLSVDDIDLWEINEAFACVPLYAMRELGIDPGKANVNGGSIAIGHPFGMTGARQVGHILLEGQRRKAKHVVVLFQCLYFSKQSPMTQPTLDGRIINPFLTRPMSKDV